MTMTTTTTPAEAPSMWVAHDYPELPLAYGAWVCDCAKCRIAVTASQARSPGLRLVIKGGMSRTAVTAAQFLRADKAEAFLTGGPDDYVREVFVAR